MPEVKVVQGQRPALQPVPDGAKEYHAGRVRLRGCSLVASVEDRWFAGTGPGAEARGCAYGLLDTIKDGDELWLPSGQVGSPCIGPAHVRTPSEAISYLRCKLRQERVHQRGVAKVVYAHVHLEAVPRVAERVGAAPAACGKAFVHEFEARGCGDSLMPTDVALARLQRLC